MLTITINLLFGDNLRDIYKISLFEINVFGKGTIYLSTKKGCDV